MIAASPKGTVPVLVLPSGRVIDESLDIMRWALGQHDPEHWLDQEDEAAPLIATNDGPFKHHLDRMKYAHRYEGADPAVHRAEALGLIEPLEARLGKSPYLCGQRMTLADVAIFPFIRQFARADLTAWQSEALPGLQRWLSARSKSSLFETVMAKHPVWTAASGSSKEAA
jgi:glutathione S-transferase